MKNAGSVEQRSLLVPGAIILLMIVFPFFFFGGPGYHASRPFMAAWNLGHIVFFSLATWLVIVLAEKKGYQKDFAFFTRVFFLILIVGIIIELIQTTIDGRTIDVGDLYRDQLGCLLAFILSDSSPITSGVLRFFSIGVVISLLLIAGWPLYQSLADVFAARRQFPILADFETPFELARWRNINQIARQQEIVRHGRYGLRVQLSTATYSGIRLFYFPGDWQGYQRLHFSVYNPNNEALFLHCRIHDTLHVQHDMRYNDRFHKRFELHTGWNDLSVSLLEVQTAPATRLMDLTQIASFGIFVVRQKRTRVLYIDYVYLSR